MIFFMQMNPRGKRQFLFLCEMFGFVDSAVITSRGALYTWGRGSHGRLGHGTVENCLTPQPVAFNAHNIERIVDVALGEIALLQKFEGIETLNYIILLLQTLLASLVLDNIIVTTYLYFNTQSTDYQQDWCSYIY